MKDYHALSYRLKIWYIRENKDSEKEKEDRDKLLEKKKDKEWDKDKDSMLEILLISLDMAGFLIWLKDLWIDLAKE